MFTPIPPNTFPTHFPIPEIIDNGDVEEFTDEVDCEVVGKDGLEEFVFAVEDFFEEERFDAVFFFGGFVSIAHAGTCSIHITAKIIAAILRRKDECWLFMDGVK